MVSLCVVSLIECLCHGLWRQDGISWQWIIDHQWEPWVPYIMKGNWEGCFWPTLFEYLWLSAFQLKNLLPYWNLCEISIKLPSICCFFPFALVWLRISLSDHFLHLSMLTRCFGLSALVPIQKSSSNGMSLVWHFSCVNRSWSNWWALFWFTFCSEEASKSAFTSQEMYKRLMFEVCRDFSIFRNFFSKELQI